MAKVVEPFNPFRELLFWVIAYIVWRKDIQSKIRNYEALTKELLFAPSATHVSRALDIWRYHFFTPRKRVMSSVRWIVR